MNFEHGPNKNLFNQTAKVNKNGNENQFNLSKSFAIIAYVGSMMMNQQ